MITIKVFFQGLLALLMIFAGVCHFLKPKVFIRIVPHYLPYPRALVFISGVFEIVGGIGLLIPTVSSAAAWGLIALYIAVFPANLNMAIHKISIGKAPIHPVLLWLRLPLQLALIAWASWYTT